jgi:hypothetical protein
MNRRPGHLKVFYAIDHYDGPSGGTEKQLLILIRHMVELGHEVRLFVFRGTEYTRSPPRTSPARSSAWASARYDRSPVFAGCEPSARAFWPNTPTSSMPFSMMQPS